MYSLVKNSSLYYKKTMGNEEYRGTLADPILLLGDLDEFTRAKNNNSQVYSNLCDLIFKIKELYKSGEDIYHAFGNYLREVADVGIDFDDLKATGSVKPSLINDQVELLRMFMCFKYVDEE